MNGQLRNGVGQNQLYDADVVNTAQKVDISEVSNRIVCATSESVFV